MNKIKKALLFAMSLAMSTCLFAGCFGSTVEESSSTNEPTTSESPVTSEDPVESVEPVAQKYELTIVTNPDDQENGSTVVELEEGATIDYPTMNDTAVKTFAGWVVVDGTGAESPAPATMPNSAITVYAKWALVVKTVTVTKLDGSTKEYKIAIEEDTTDAENPVLSIEKIADALKADITADTNYYTVAYVGMPETWEVQDYAISEVKTNIVKTVTVTKIDGSTKVYKIAIEGDDTDAENLVFGIEKIADVLVADMSADGSYYTVAYEGMPEVWDVQDYAIKEVMTKFNDNDVTSQIAFFDRINKWLLNSDGSIKQNMGNYWDGASNIVTVENQQAVTSGSDSAFAVKVTFDPALLTEEQKTEATSDETSMWPAWDLQQMWVTYAIPVTALNINLTTITFDMKVDNMNGDVTVYGAKKAADGMEYVYEIGKNFSLKQSAAQNLGDGWFRYTFNGVDASWASREADYFVFSLDNCQTGYDKSKASVAYIDNVTFTANTAHKHEYTMAIYNTTSHSATACVCGEAKPGTAVAHTMVKNNSETHHWEECTCGYKAGYGAHEFVYEASENEGMHKQTCACGKSSEEEHSGVWVSEETRDVKKCACGAIAEEFKTMNEMVTTIVLNIDSADQVTETYFGIFEIIDEEYMEYVENGLWWDLTYGDLSFLIDEEGVAWELWGDDGESISATIFNNMQGETYVTYVFVTEDGAFHNVKVKVNIVWKE